MGFLPRYHDARHNARRKHTINPIDARCLRVPDRHRPRCGCGARCALYPCAAQPFAALHLLAPRTRGCYPTPADRPERTPANCHLFVLAAHPELASTRQLLDDCGALFVISEHGENTMKSLRIRKYDTNFYYILALVAVIAASGCPPPPPSPPGPQPTVTEEQIGGIAEIRGTVTRPLSTTGGPGLLSAFYFKFLHDDHPLQTIAVHPLRNTIEVAFADRDPTSEDDEYFGTIIYQHINDPRIIEKSASLPICISHCPLIDDQLRDCESRGECVFILRGFKFTYARNDFAIKKFAILENNGAIDTELHDRSGLNQFAVIVDYAIVPRALVSSSASVEGESRGATRRFVPPGVATLSGFSFEYLDDDFRMFELGALARQPVSPGPNIEVYFSDRTQDRRIRYKVAYNIMNVMR